jgi:hypothetical protein
MLRTFVSFSNELSIEKKNYARSSRFNPHIYVSFLNELAIEMKTMLTAFVSFFNELATKKKNYAHGFFFIMASKRKMLWKEYMSRDKRQSWLPRDCC